MKKIAGLIVLSLSLGMSSALFAHGSKGSLGTGIGFQYGLLGVNLDLKVTDNLYATAGVGRLLDITGWSVGAKYYFLDADRTWRPRAILLYGVNGALVKQSYFVDDEYESFTGISVGLGQSIAFGRSRTHGLDVDLLYRVTDGGLSDRFDELEDEGYDVKNNEGGSVFLSIGYRFNF